MKTKATAAHVSLFEPGAKFGRAIDVPEGGDVLRSLTGAMEAFAPEHSLKGYAAGYESLWASAKPSPSWLPTIDQIIERTMVGNRARYERVQLATGIPWFVIAIIHMMEGSGSFSTWLANGDPLTAPTRQVPAGLGKGESFPLSWERGAELSIEHDGLDKVTDWTVAGIAYRFEAFNGFGYRSKGINSPYLWAQSNQWLRGKYVADGRYDPNAGSSQIGAMVYLRRLHDRGLIQIDGVARNPEAPPAPREPAALPVVEQGDVGWYVRAVQHGLNGCGYGPLTVDGEFGAMTTLEVREFQKDLGLEVDGVVGANTWAALTAHAKLSGWVALGQEVRPTTPKGLRARVVEAARVTASKGRSHAPGNWIDQNVLDPLRPAMVAKGHLGASQKDTFWNWCAGWTTYVLRQCAVKVPDQFPHAGSWATVALVQEWTDYAQSIGAWIPVGTKAPVAGDVVVYDWDGDRYADHIGIVLVAHGRTAVRAAEGNRGNVESVVERSFGIRGYIDLEILAARLGVG